MISIERPAAPAFLSDAKQIWHEETVEAIEYYNAAAVEKSFEFKAYSDPRLKAELKKIFPKCAYCETVYAAGYDGDIEHFRPKGQVSEKAPKSPGYYWLANDWDNLLLSCQHCNQRRKHQLEGATKLETLGKLDQFPLSDEAKRVRRHGESLDEEEKVRLILNPCRDKPEEHFEYDRDHAVIIPRTEQGKSSVKVYALQRVLLVQERKKQLLLLYQQMARVKRELERFNAENTAEQKKIFDEELDYLLNNFTKRESPYAGMCRYFVRQFLTENGLR